VSIYICCYKCVYKIEIDKTASQPYLLCAHVQPHVTSRPSFAMTCISCSCTCSRSRSPTRTLTIYFRLAIILCRNLGRVSIERAKWRLSILNKLSIVLVDSRSNSRIYTCTLILYIGSVKKKDLIIIKYDIPILSFPQRVEWVCVLSDETNREIYSDKIGLIKYSFDTL